MALPGWTRLCPAISSGGVHKVRHAIFGSILNPSPVTYCHTSRDPLEDVTHLGTPQFLVVRPTCIHTFVFTVYREVCLSSRGFCLEGFVRVGFRPSPILSEYMRYNRTLNITFNFRFHMHEK